MAVNLLSNAGFETGLLLPEWASLFGEPVVTTAQGAFEGTFAAYYDGNFAAVSLLANSTGPVATIGQRYYMSSRVKKIGATPGSIALTLSDVTDVVVSCILLSDGTFTVYKGSPNDGVILRSVTFDNLDTFNFFEITDIAPRAEQLDFGIVVPALFAPVATEFRNKDGEWLVDDCWLGTDPQPVRVTRPDNGPGESTFDRSDFDVIHGTLHKENRLERDWDKRLRRRDDIDGLDRDDYDWPTRQEHPGEDP